MRLTFREMRSQVFNLLGQQQDGVIEPKEVKDELNTAYRELVKEFGLCRASYTASAVSGSQMYAPPPDLIELERVDFDTRKMEFVLVEEITDFGDSMDIETPTWTEDV